MAPRTPKASKAAPVAQAAGHRMSAADASFWYSEALSPGLRSTVGGLMILDAPPDFAKYRACMERWVQITPRLREKVVEQPLRLMLPEWVHDEHMDLDYHLRREALPAPGNEETLFALISQIMATPLDRARPQWEIYVFEGLKGGKGAILHKLHHSMVDGVGSLSLLDTFTELSAKASLRLPPVPRVMSRERGPRSFLVEVVDDGTEIARDVLETAGQAMGFAKEIMIHPMRTAGRAMTTARATIGLLQDMGKSKIVDPIAEGAAGMARRMDRMSVSLKDLRRVHKAIGATLNDLVLTAVSGAVGRYHAKRGVAVETLRAMVPMNLRTDHDRDALGNRLGFLNISLPVGEEDPRRRLAIIQQETGRAKGDRRGAMYPYLARFVTSMPTFVFRAVVAGTAGNVNLICTNVPGTPDRRWITGRRIEAIIPFAPVLEKCPMSFALFSYVDKFGIGIATDPEAIPDHDRLRRYLEEAFEEVLSLDAKSRGRKAGAARPKAAKARVAGKKASIRRVAKRKTH